jgi:hypothetical protein
VEVFDPASTRVENHCNSPTEKFTNPYFSDMLRRGFSIYFALQNRSVSKITMFALVILVGLLSNMKMCTPKLKLINTSSDIDNNNKYTYIFYLQVCKTLTILNQKQYKKKVI